MKYKMKLGIWNSVFCVPSVVADNYLKLARGSDIKVLLFLLRNSDEYISSEIIADKLGLSAEQVDESIVFWKDREIIGVDDSGEATPLQKYRKTGDEDVNTQTENKAAVPQIKPVAESLVRKINLERTPDFPPAEIAKTIRNNDKADYLFKHCEILYGRPLNHNEQRTLMIILEDACLPVESALMLVDYCFSINKATPAYMRAMALEWSESEINTIDKAERRVEELKKSDSAIGRFKSMFEINSAFSKQQREMIGKWVNIYGFDDEMINEAYQITLNGAGRLSFPYMNKILEGWHSKGYKNVGQIGMDKKPKKSKNGEKGENASLDITKIEQFMTDKYKKTGGSA